MNRIPNIIKKLKAKFKSNNPKISHGPKGIKQVGHRQYIGGLWEEIGKLQFDFLVNNGLKSSDVLMDIACGSLRAGVHLIPYLKSGHYLGIDKEQSLINLGLKNEIKEDILDQKKPKFVISDNFEFNKFDRIPNFAIAQSLFTHLPPPMINKCFVKLKKHFAKDGVFYATYFITENVVENPRKAHDHGIFRYTPDAIISFGTTNGWNAEIIGDWNHPRNQKIVKYTPMNSD